MPRSSSQVRAAVLSYPPPISQSSRWRPDAKGSQSASAAQREGSRAPKPRAGLVHQAHRFTCSRRGWWGAGIFAGAACLAWLAWPNLAFAQAPGVAVSETALSVPEGGSASYTVVLVTQPTDDVTITVGRSPSADDDLTASPDTLTFTNSNWNTEQTVTVTAAEDADGEPGIALFRHLVASSPGTVYDGLPAPGVRTTEDDNDTIGVIVSPTTLSVPEGGSATYTVKLGTKPLNDVTVEATRDQRSDADLTVSSDKDTDTNITSVTLPFTNSNWNTEQTVTVTAAEDADEVDDVAIFSHTATSFGDDYAEIYGDAVTATEADNEKVVTVEIQTEVSAPVRGVFEVMIIFSEAVTGFERSEIAVTNGSVTDFSGSAPTYKAEITPSKSGEVIVEVGANVGEYGVGNGNIAGAPLVLEADLERPEVTIEGPTEPLGIAGFKVTITFSEPVEGFELEDIQVTNGTASKFTKISPQEYTATITPEGTGEVRVEVSGDVAEDRSGNGNIAGAPLVLEADLERPEVTIEGPMEPLGIAGFKVTITFSEPVEGFELEDIQVTNGTASKFTKISPQEYTATITPEGTGEVRVEVSGDVAEDRSGNGNRAAEPFEVEAKLVVSYQEEDYTATEGGETVAVTVKLSQAGDEELAIPIRVTRPEETEVGDYTVEGLEDWDGEAGIGTLAFPAGETEQTLRIAANHDGDGDDETVELGFGELPEIVMAGEPAVATVTLEDKGLVELTVSFVQAAYEVKEGRQADIEMEMSPAADRRVEVPLVVVSIGGATDEDYRGVPASVVFEEGGSQGTISVELLADEVNDPGEGIVLSLGGLPEGVSEGEISQTTVNFIQHRTAEQFSQTLEAMLAVIARSTAASAQAAIEGRFERYRQWSRLGSSDEAVPTPQPGSANSGAAVSPGDPERIGSRRIDGTVRRGPVEPSASDAAKTSAATGSWRRSFSPGSLRSFSLGSLASFARSDPSDPGPSAGSGMAPGGRVYGQDRLWGSGVGEAPLGLEDLLGMRDQELSLSGVSFEMSLGESEQETSRVSVLWGQGDLQHFNGDLARLGMNYRGDLNAAHVGLDLYANKQVLAGLSFMRSWGTMDYADDGVDGVLESDLNTFHPYLYWQPNERVSVWGIGGLGTGQVDVKEPGRTHDFDADFRMFAGGVRTVLSRRGNNEWGLRADAFTAQLETDAADDIAEVSGEAHRGRLMLEWVHDRELSAGRSLSLKAEAGGRFDRGDAERGAGLETGFSLGYLDANRGLDVALQGRVLVVHESDYRDWGVGVQASWDPGEKQRGFRAAVMSSWGQDGGGQTTLWDNADAVTHPAGIGELGTSSQYQMESEVAYGAMNALGLPGLMTPYSRMRWAGHGREVALGIAWSLPTHSKQALPLALELEAIRRENRTRPADLAVLMRMSTPL